MEGAKVILIPSLHLAHLVLQPKQAAHGTIRQLHLQEDIACMQQTFGSPCAPVSDLLGCHSHDTGLPGGGHGMHAAENPTTLSGSSVPAVVMRFIPAG